MPAEFHMYGQVVNHLRLLSTTAFAQNQEVVVVSATRTPITCSPSSLPHNSVSLSTGLRPDQIEEIYKGYADTIEATTLNKVCVSDMKAISLATQNLQLGVCKIVVPGRMESITNDVGDVLLLWVVYRRIAFSFEIYKTHMCNAVTMSSATSPMVTSSSPTLSSRTGCGMRTISFSEYRWEHLCGNNGCPRCVPTGIEIPGHVVIISKPIHNMEHGREVQVRVGG
ncbi:hypothetical protein BC938DRAFT_477433 [Jimgerdemannia flammicorona]|uniref:Thiolase N-terminal domain-containing protein n=1 Tax=Jimgerdemannia flammicorona TaxID=994334 RepID=A0A433P9U1_9FUNG|nr:hypothetical protein BC938DRAFT_477433 [Jimgerdemannia flammicorona]